MYLLLHCSSWSSHQFDVNTPNTALLPRLSLMLPQEKTNVVLYEHYITTAIIMHLSQFPPSLFLGGKIHPNFQPVESVLRFCSTKILQGLSPVILMNAAKNTAVTISAVSASIFGAHTDCSKTAMFISPSACFSRISRELK